MPGIFSKPIVCPACQTQLLAIYPTTSKIIFAAIFFVEGLLSVCASVVVSFIDFPMKWLIYSLVLIGITLLTLLVAFFVAQKQVLLRSK
jgi:predicted Co/Zn/Cd cation transporter (cation efflux family)